MEMETVHVAVTAANGTHANITSVLSDSVNRLSDDVFEPIQTVLDILSYSFWIGAVVTVVLMCFVSFWCGATCRALRKYRERNTADDSDIEVVDTEDEEEAPKAAKRTMLSGPIPDVAVSTSDIVMAPATGETSFSN